VPTALTDAGPARLPEELDAPPAPASDEVPTEGVELLRELMATDALGFEGLLETWAADVTDAVARGEYRVAAAWLGAVLVNPTYPPERAAAVEAAVEVLSRPESLDDLLVRLAAADAGPGGPELVAAWGAPLADYMIDLMVVDDPPVSRRRLIEFLGWAGRSDVRLLVAHLNDPRWFVVRNLAIALGKSGRSSAIPALERLVTHPEARVRVEALRSLALLGGVGTVERLASGLSDRSSRVRHAALTLLRANPDPAVVPALVAVLDSGRVDAEQARRLVSAIAERKHDGVVDALERIAGRRFAVRAGRAARDTARTALERLRSGPGSR
jgi:HEAT repeat protein